MLLFNSQHCGWLSGNALHSLCRGKQALGTNSLLAQAGSVPLSAPPSVGAEFCSCCLMQLFAVHTALCSYCVAEVQQITGYGYLGN